jgi:peptide deformylase
MARPAPTAAKEDRELMPLLSRPPRLQALPVRFCGDPVLQKRATDVPRVTPAIRELADAMLVTLAALDGIGLAAPQVGRSINLVVVNVPPPDADEPPATSPGELALLPRMPLVLVNPKLSEFSPQTVVGAEGCLSIPKLRAAVERPEFVRVTFQTLAGEPLSYRCGGLLARCLQHEVDHLNGILFVDRVPPEQLAPIAAALAALRQETQRQLARTRNR